MPLEVTRWCGAEPLTGGEEIFSPQTNPAIRLSIALSNDALKQDLLRDAVLVTGHRVRLSHLPMFPLTIILGVFLWGDVEPLRLFVGLGVLNALAIRGLLLGRRFVRMRDEPDEIAWFADKYRSGIVMYGAAAGAFSVLLIVPGEFALQFPIVMTIVGMASAGVTTQVAFPWAMHLYHVISMTPIVVVMVVEGSDTSLAVAGTIVILGIGLTIVGRGGAASFRNQSLIKIEKSRLAEELEIARQQLAASNEVLDSRVQAVTESLAQANQLASLGQLAAGVAHEINNPLTWVVSNAEYVRDNVEDAVMDPEAKTRISEAVEDIVAGGSRIAAIVKDMTSLAHDDGIPANVDLHMLVRRCVRVARKTIGIGVGVQWHLDAPAPIVAGNATRLSQLILNILLNAAEAIADDLSTTKNEGVISVHTRVSDGYLNIEIHDNGSGIDVEPIERVFEPFYTTKRSGSGCGLGLTICRNIAEAHAGTIHANSNETGTTLSLSLPLAPSDEAEQQLVSSGS